MDKLHLETPMSKKMLELFERLEVDLDNNNKIKDKITGYLAGGMAVHLYTGDRVTGDIDIELTQRVYIPDDLVVEIKQKNGDVDYLYIDKNYNSTFALMHPDYKDDAVKLGADLKYFNIYLLNPTDLAVSKISRFGQNDMEDIKALARLGLINHREIEKRADEAMDYFVGNLDRLKHNIKDAVKITKENEKEICNKSNFKI